MDNNLKMGFLKDEYLLLQKFYEDYDARVVTMKGWSATIGLAAIAGGFYQSNYLWLFAVITSLIFWTLESIWKTFQYMYAPRIAEIEKVFRDNDLSSISPFQIYTSWFAVFNKRGFKILGPFKMRIVSFPHLIIVVMGLILFAINITGLIHLSQK